MRCAFGYMTGALAIAACGGGGSDRQGEIVVLNSGGGRITASETGSPYALDCGPTCRAFFDFGSSVELTAIPQDGETFLGWGGGCSGTGDCVVAPADYVEVRAAFGPPSVLSSSGFAGRAIARGVTSAGDGAILAVSSGENSATSREHLLVRPFGMTVNWTLESDVGGIIERLATLADETVIAVGSYDARLRIQNSEITDVDDGQAGFVLAFDPADGGLVSLDNVDGTGPVAVTSVAGLADPAGMAILGTFSGQVSAGSAALTGAGGQDVFVATKIGAVWTMVALASGQDDQAIALAADGQGQLWAALRVGTDTQIGGVAVQPGFALVVLDDALTVQRVLALGGDAPPVRAGDLAVAGSDIVVAFSFAGSISLAGRHYAAMGDADWLVARLTPIGDVLWVQQLGGVGTDLVSAIGIMNDRVYLAGSFEGEFLYGQQSIYGHANLTNPDTTIVDDGLVVALDLVSGTSSWARRFGGWATDSLAGAAASQLGLVVIGTFGGGPYSLGVPTPSEITSTPAALALALED